VNEQPNQRRGPFTITSTREVYRNPWIAVREDKVQNDSGREGLFGVVDLVPGVSVLAVDENQRIPLIREFKYAYNDHTLELVSGGIDEGEQPLEAAKRELTEETGLVASEWETLGVITPFTTVIDSPNHMFLATGLSHGPAKPDDWEALEVVWLGLGEAVEQVMAGQIPHGGSCVAILKAARMLGL